VPLAISLLFGLAALLGVAGSLQAAKGAPLAAVGLALTAVPTFVLLSAAQMADVPLACFTVLAITLPAGRDSSAASLALAGAAAGLAGWTKNEGLIVAGVFPACYVLLLLRRDGIGAARHAAKHLSLGWLPVVVLVVWFKLRFAPENEVVAGLSSFAAWAQWSDADRLRGIVGGMTRGLMEWGGWPIAGPAWLLALLVLYPGSAAAARREPAVSAAGVLLAVQLAVFCGVFVTTRNPLAWQMDTTWFRLIAQLWPAAVWWACARR
jgi:hypothetical protein